MSFLAPLFLLGALALAGPVFFHLIRRATQERTLFSSIMFLPPTRLRLTRRSRVEHLLLLLLRCLALGLLAVGFARPFWRRTAPAGGTAAEFRRAVLLIDVSASMRRTGLWDEARERAGAVLRTLAPGDEAAVFAFSREVTPLVSFEEWKATPAGERRALALGRLAAAQPGWEDDHLGDALIRAAEALAEGDAEKRSAGPRQIFLISDLKAGSRLDSLQAYDWPKEIELRIEPLKARNPTNAGVQWVADPADADRLAAPVVRVRVSNAADSRREQFNVGWVKPLGHEPIGAAVDIYVPPGQSRVVAVPVPAPATDLRQIALRGDDEDFDNSVYLVPPEPQRWSVLYFGSEAADDVHEPLFFLQHALPDNPHLTVKALVRAPSASIAPGEMQEAKLAFVTEAVAPETAAALHRQMLAGKTVLFAPKSALAASSLGPLLGGAGPAMAEVRPADYAMFGAIDFRHPLFAPFADPAYSDFTKIHVWNYRRLDAAAIPGARVVARFDRGDPALVEVPVGAGRLLVLLTGWNPADSQLAVSSKFVPLIYSLLEFAGGPSDDAERYTVGDAIPLHPAAGIEEATTVRLPDGTSTTLPVGAAAFKSTQPGIFELSAGRRSWRVAVNVAASESRTEPLAADELERYGAPGPHPPADDARSARRDALVQEAETENRQKLWRWLLGATLAVLLLESALAGWTARRNDLTVAPGGNPS